MNVSNNQTLLELSADLFALNVYIRESGYVEDPDALYDRVVSLLTTMEENARSLKIPDPDVQDSKYALVGIIDETVGWASRLEQEFFGRNVAGEEFFNRLEKIKESKGRNEALKVYYTCLTLGFEGRHFRNPGRIQEYIKELQELLGVKSIGNFSPHGGRPQEKIQRRSTGIPIWVPWAVAGAGIVALVVICVVLRIRIDTWAANLVNRITRLLS